MRPPLPRGPILSRPEIRRQTVLQFLPRSPAMGRAADVVGTAALVTVGRRLRRARSASATRNGFDGRGTVLSMDWRGKAMLSWWLRLGAIDELQKEINAAF